MIDVVDDDDAGGPEPEIESRAESESEPKLGAGKRTFETARTHIIRELVAFVRALRREGVRVPANGSVDAARAIAAVGLEDRRRVRAGLRTALLSSEDDARVFERLFPAFWRGVNEDGEDRDRDREQDPEWTPPEMDGAPASAPSRTSVGDESPTDRDPGASTERGREFRRSSAGDADGSEPDGDEDGERATASVYSATGAGTPIRVPPPMAESERLERAVDRLGDSIARSRGRRLTRTEAERADVRRALRRSVATGGAVLSVPRTGRERSVVRAVLLVDVSRSVLDTIDREFLLEFLGCTARRWRDVRIFFFDTEVREVTDAFDEPGRAGAALERAEAEWGGGTRIGNAIDAVRTEHPDAVDRETSAFVVSDGFEVGEIPALEDGMVWLSRRAHGVVWLNPLAGSAEYEPTCRGMAASLPYVDGLFAFAGIDDVEELARQLERREFDGPIGYRYRSDSRT